MYYELLGLYIWRGVYFFLKRIIRVGGGVVGVGCRGIVRFLFFGLDIIEINVK